MRASKEVVVEATSLANTDEAYCQYASYVLQEISITHKLFEKASLGSGHKCGSLFELLVLNGDLE